MSNEYATILFMEVRIMEVDKNFIVDTNITETDIEWFDIRTEPFSIHGVKTSAMRKFSKS